MLTPHVSSVLRSLLPALGLVSTWWLTSATQLCCAQPMPIEVPRVEPLSPQASLAAIQVADGFRVELVASEPLVSDPIDIAWDASGRIWIVEMGDYPRSEGGSVGQIRVLRDVDGDGVPDASTVFLSDLHFPSSVLPWREGAIVACAPDIFYAYDEDGDGIADRREVLLTGFTVANPMHRVNSLQWGVDNWVYAANGESGGEVESPKTGEVVDLHGHDFRFDPRTGQIELLTGMSQFARCRDDLGNWFGGNSDYPIWHVLIEHRYLVRNRATSLADMRRHLMDPPLNGRVFPIRPADIRWSVQPTGNVFTSACAPAIYRDDRFDTDLGRPLFVCEPEHNLVHRSIMEADGYTFTSRRTDDEQRSEFLASRDLMFRPVRVKTGPDGALWIVDMYRRVIEHPDLIPSDRVSLADLRQGAGLGRLYRVVSLRQPPRESVNLNDMSHAELLEALQTDNGTTRDLVQQMLIDGFDSADVEPLRQCAADSTAPAVRLSALSILAHCDVLDSKTLSTALADRHAAVRRYALLLAERHANETEMLPNLLSLADDSHPAVGLQWALSAGHWRDRRVGDALARYAIRAAGDPVVETAILSSSAYHADAILDAVYQLGDANQVPLSLVTHLLRDAAQQDELRRLCDGLLWLTAETGTASLWRYELMGQLWPEALRAFDRASDADATEFENIGRVRDAVSRWIDTARRLLVEQPSLPTETRTAIVRLLASEPERVRQDLQVLKPLLSALNPPELRAAVIETLGAVDSSETSEMLIESWPEQGPEIRKLILDTLLRRANWASELLDQIERDSRWLASISVTQRAQLLLHPDATIRSRAKQCLETDLTRDRLEIVRQYESIADRQGDAIVGAKLFQEHCASCHEVRDGQALLGPDLRSVTDLSTPSLLQSILDPNRIVLPRYQAYVAETDDGRIVNGLLIAESRNDLVMQAVDGTRTTIPREELIDFIGTGRTLMPDGFEKVLTDDQAMADLIAFLRSAEFRGQP